MMNEKYLNNEIKNCKAKIRQLQKDIMTETNISAGVSKIDEMVELAKMMIDFKEMKKNMKSNNRKMKLRKMFRLA